MPEKKSSVLKVIGITTIGLSALQLLFFVNQFFVKLFDIPEILFWIVLIGIVATALILLVLSITNLVNGIKGALVLLIGSISLLSFELLVFFFTRAELQKVLFGTEVIRSQVVDLSLILLFFVFGIIAIVSGLIKRRTQAGYWGFFSGLAPVFQLVFFIGIFIPMLTSGMGGQGGDQKIIQGCHGNQQALSEGMKLYMDMEYLPLHPAATPDELLKAAQELPLTFDGFKVMVGGKEIHYGSSKPETFSCPGNKKSQGNDYKVTGYTPATDGKLGTFRVECQFNPKHNLLLESK